jgi:hypothetical protein
MDKLGTLVYRRNLIRDAEADDDVQKFIIERLAGIASQYELDEDWPGSASRSALIEKAGGFFIWASTAIKFIEDEDVENPAGQLSVLLRSNVPVSDLDSLYLHVLTNALSKKASPHRFAALRKVIGAIITVQSPLAATALDSLLGLDFVSNTPDQSVRQTVRRLHSVLIVPEAGPLQIVHPSFADFLVNPQRCVDPDFLIEPTHQHRFLVVRCLELMNEKLAYNICGVNPYLFNSENEDIQDSVARVVPESLQYACRYWADHLSSLSQDNPYTDKEDKTAIIRHVETFYREHLLFWLEALSLLGSIDSALRCLELAEICLPVR